VIRCRGARVGDVTTVDTYTKVFVQANKDVSKSSAKSIITTLRSCDVLERSQSAHVIKSENNEGHSGEGKYGYGQESTEPDNFRNVKYYVKDVTVVHILEGTEEFSRRDIPDFNALVIASADKAHGSRIK
jgi:primase-polymerase (primpol)-like protein